MSSQPHRGAPRKPGLLAVAVACAALSLLTVAVPAADGAGGCFIAAEKGDVDTAPGAYVSIRYDVSPEYASRYPYVSGYMVEVWYDSAYLEISKFTDLSGAPLPQKGYSNKPGAGSFRVARFVMITERVTAEPVAGGLFALGFDVKGGTEGETDVAVTAYNVVYDGVKGGTGINGIPEFATENPSLLPRTLTVVSIAKDNADAAEYGLKISYVGPPGDDFPAPSGYTAGFAPGQAYSVDSPSVPGYSPDRANVSGTMGVGGVSIVVTYHADEGGSSLLWLAVMLVTVAAAAAAAILLFRNKTARRRRRAKRA